MKVTVEDGKYTVEQYASGRVFALRHGDPWRECTGDKLLLALAQRVESLEERLCKQIEASSEVKRPITPMQKFNDLVEMFDAMSLGKFDQCGPCLIWEWLIDHNIKYKGGFIAADFYSAAYALGYFHDRPFSPWFPPNFQSTNPK